MCTQVNYRITDATMIRLGETDVAAIRRARGGGYRVCWPCIEGRMRAMELYYPNK